MADEEALQELRKGASTWNPWKREHGWGRIDLDQANLSGTNLKSVDLSRVDLARASFSQADLSHADLSRSTVTLANLRRTSLLGADLSWADLRGAELVGADLEGANLQMANLMGANLSQANLLRADLAGSTVGATIFASVDLREVRGLEHLRHALPSTLGVDTLYRSAGKIPEVFLRGCGVPDEFIAYLPSLVGAQQVIQFYSCFISYSTKDEEFAKRLHSRLQQEHVRVWFAPEDMKGGQKLHEQIDRAIEVHDRLLLVLSEYSIKSQWVENEIRHAIRQERKENRRKLFPIGVAPYRVLEDWKCIDSRTGVDLAEEVRSYFIPDFSNWKDHDAFQAAFTRLLRDLRAEEERQV
jgi:hypothetical protein